MADCAPPNSITFPPDDLIHTLFGLFFRHFTPFLPIIHQPSFEAQFKDGLHKRNTSFAIVVLLVCAIASRYCNDPRVCLKDGGRPSAGWKYFVQVKDLKRSLHAPAKLSDLQTYAVSPACYRISPSLNVRFELIGSVTAGGLLSTSHECATFRVDGHWDRHSMCSRYRRSPEKDLSREYIPTR